MKTLKLYNNEIIIYFDDELDKNGKQKHAYWIDGEEKKKNGEPKRKRLTGITTYCGLLDKSQFLIPWAVGETIKYIRKNLDQLQDDPKELLKRAQEEAERQKQEAADLGKAIHSYIEQHIKGENPEMPDDEKVLRGVIAFTNFIKEHNVEFLESEKVVYSRQHGYVGILDIIAKINGKIYLLDIKTGNAIYEEAKMQTAAYLKADMEERKTAYQGRAILRISKETEDEYKQRMAEKNKAEYPAYQQFELVFLDEPLTIERDFASFLACKKVYEWRNEARKELYAA